MLLTMSQVHGAVLYVAFDGQMIMSDSTRSNIQSQVYIHQFSLGLRSGSQSEDRPEAAGLECSECTQVWGLGVGAVRRCDQNV